MKLFTLLIILTRLRLVSLAPSITEIIYYSGLQEYLVGNTIYCNYPEEAKKLPHVGDLINPSIEKIKKLHPDYVLLVTPMQNRLISKLKKAGLRTIVCRQSNFNDILLCAYKIGKIAGDTTGFVKLKKAFKSLDTLPKYEVTILFILSRRPIYTAGKNTFLDEIIRKAGGKNPLEFEGYKMISLEDIVKINPDIIVIAYPNPNLRSFKNSIGIRRTKAAINNCIFQVSPDIFTRPGPRVKEATLILHNYIKNCIKKDAKYK